MFSLASSLLENMVRAEIANKVWALCGHASWGIKLTTFFVSQKNWGFVIPQSVGVQPEPEGILSVDHPCHILIQGLFHMKPSPDSKLVGLNGPIPLKSSWNNTSSITTAETPTTWVQLQRISPKRTFGGSMNPHVSPRRTSQQPSLHYPLVQSNIHGAKVQWSQR